MRAIVIREPGDESVLQMGEAPSPALGPADLRIRVRTTAVNRADLLQRQGLYPPPPGVSPILGMECAGEVRARHAEAAVEVGAQLLDLTVEKTQLPHLPVEVAETRGEAPEDHRQHDGDE